MAEKRKGLETLIENCRQMEAATKRMREILEEELESL